MKGIRTYRKISMEVTAVQITKELFSEKVPASLKDKIVINPASRQVLLYGKGRETITGKLTDWIVMDNMGNFSIFSHGEFVKDFEPADDEVDIESGIKIPDPIIGVDPGSGDSTVTGIINAPPGEDINLDDLGNKDNPDDLTTNGVDSVVTGDGENKEKVGQED